MKFTMKLLVLIFGALMLANLAVAESPREHLKELVHQLQQNPDNDALRAQIIKLAHKIKPLPAMPGEAERRMVRGTVAFKEAKSVGDYQAAVTEFLQATLAAPWDGDAYFNLGVAQDKAEQYDAALRSLQLAQLALPNSKDVQDLIYKVQYHIEQAHDPAVLAARQTALQAANDEALINHLDGALFVLYQGNPAYQSMMTVRINGGYATLSDVVLSVTELGRQDGELPGTILYANNRDPMPHVGRTFTGRDGMKFEVSPDGQSITMRAGADAPLTLIKQ